MPGLGSIDPNDPNILRMMREGRIVDQARPGRPVEPVAPAVSGEEEFQREVISLAKAHGWAVAHFRRVRVQRKDGSVYWETPVAADGAGFPDLLLIRRTRVIVAELKFGKNRPSEAQKVWLGRFGAAGVPWYVWYPDQWATIVAVLAAPGEPPPRPSPSGPGAVHNRRVLHNRRSDCTREVSSD